jgi:hypothetical protein
MLSQVRTLIDEISSDYYCHGATTFSTTAVSITVLMLIAECRIFYCCAFMPSIVILNSISMNVALPSVIILNVGMLSLC